MVNFRPDDYGMRTAETTRIERTAQAGEVNTNQAHRADSAR